MMDFETDSGPRRDDLVQRIELMEAMIAEGRRSTARFGWIFVLWGLVDLAGMAWQWLQPDSLWVWPVILSSGFVLQFLGILVLRRKDRPVRGVNMRGRSVAAVWQMMGLCMVLYVAPAIARHLTWQLSYVAAVLMIIGLAHAISARVLRWMAQGIVAALWWVSGIAIFLVPSRYLYAIVCGDLLFGMVLFGLYGMWLERRPASVLVEHNA